jgi:hypothetical protein
MNTVAAFFLNVLHIAKDTLFTVTFFFYKGDCNGEAILENENPQALNLCEDDNNPLLCLKGTYNIWSGREADYIIDYSLCRTYYILADRLSEGLAHTRLYL